MPTILYFDGFCHLCHGSVQFVLRHEKNQDLKFATIQGERAQREFPAELNSEDSLVLEENGEFFIRSAAALRLIKYLKWYCWPLNIFWVVPRFINDAVYKWVARNRYGWFGKYDSCELPDKTSQERLIKT